MYHAGSVLVGPKPHTTWKPYSPRHYKHCATSWNKSMLFILPLSSSLVLHCASLMYRSNQGFNIPPPPPFGQTPGIWHLCHPGEKGIWLSESSRGGEFDPHALEVGNLNCTLNIMWNLWHGNPSLKRLCLCGQLVARKGLKQTLCRIKDI